MHAKNSSADAHNARFVCASYPRPTGRELKFMQNQNSTLQAKSLTILGDQMQHEYVACKKSEFYAKNFSDPQLQTIANQLASDHRQRFNRLLNYLNSHA